MTKAEEEWIEAITDIGCVACFVQGFPGTPGEVHHMLDEGGRRLGHLHTLCLCSPGHHRNATGGQKISRHPFKARFEKAYGTEAQLLELEKRLVEQRAERLRISTQEHQ